METPSGKSAPDENFPVGSRLLPARLRPHVAAFYAYARAIDDIADNPELAPADKVDRLDGFARAVSGAESTDPAYRKGHDVRRSLAETGVTHHHCVDLTRAFKQDATRLRYDDWDDLIGYCNFSAAPVGRYLVDLHGESREAYPASDALCNALQVLNHLQDCGDDYRALNRVYLPQDWMAEAGVGVEVLGGKRSPAALRRVLDRCLDASDGPPRVGRAPAGAASRHALRHGSGHHRRDCQEAQPGAPPAGPSRGTGRADEGAARGLLRVRNLTSRAPEDLPPAFSGGGASVGSRSSGRKRGPLSRPAAARSLPP